MASLSFGSPQSFMKYDDGTLPDWLSSEASTGTSIMAVEYPGGVVIGADSRATTGAYIANRIADKLTRVTDHIYCLRSGSSADTQAITDIVSYHLAFHEIELNEKTTVQTAANVFKELCYNYRDQLSAGIICAGWDKINKGQVYSIPIGGMVLRQPVAVGGSGCTYIFGFVDANYRSDMTKEECVDFVKRATKPWYHYGCGYGKVLASLGVAMARDGSSGGIIRLGVITESGIERQIFHGAQLPKFYEG